MNQTACRAWSTMVPWLRPMRSCCVSSSHSPQNSTTAFRTPICSRLRWMNSRIAVSITVNVSWISCSVIHRGTRFPPPSKSSWAMKSTTAIGTCCSPIRSFAPTATEPLLLSLRCRMRCFRWNCLTSPTTHRCCSTPTTPTANRREPMPPKCPSRQLRRPPPIRGGHARPAAPPSTAAAARRRARTARRPS